MEQQRITSRGPFLRNLGTSLVAALILCLVGHFLGAPLLFTVGGSVGMVVLSVVFQLSIARPGTERLSMTPRRAIALLIVIPALCGPAGLLFWSMGLPAWLGTTLLMTYLVLLNVVYFVWFDAEEHS